ncbi:hypothetical protein M408DRAFT_110822 [Serendipita vermifera MAFF 305830]|uniref:Uncharacterized protein n=1 Tax=Serendipita vermifera MAFF 305830 TaxID=933852 RepID=A0A0C3A971_SERVB|nr:hypothetical protein M408DRAFT_110822 [Serendipita vermifera MAFF 305830]
MMVGARKWASRRKVVFIGDLNSGKTSLISALVSADSISGLLLPPVYDVCTFTTEVNRRVVEMELWDTYAQRYCNDTRMIAYYGSVVVVLCFAIDAPQSFRTIRERWYPEILHFVLGAPILLVGCKSDIRLLPNPPVSPGRGELITPNQGWILADEVGAVEYLECSATQRDSIAMLRDALGRVVMSCGQAAPSNRADKRNCTIV